MSDFKRKVKFKVKRAIYWDNDGQIVKAFNIGETVVGDGILSRDGKNVLEIIAESTVHRGFRDFVDMKCVEVLEIIDSNHN